MSSRPSRPPRLPRVLGIAAAAIGAFALVLPAAPAGATTTGTTYYVSCGGGSQGDGSIGHPWKSLAVVNTHASYQPGDQILLKRGTTCKGRFATTGSGVAGAPIVLGAYGSGSRPTVAGGGTSNGSGAVQLTDQQYWTVRDLHVTNVTASKSPHTYRSGVLVLNSGIGRVRGITLSGLSVSSVRSSAADGQLGPRDWGGISVLTYGAHGDGFDGLRITNNTVQNVSRTGIVVSNHNYPKSYDRGARIDHNTVTQARGDSIFVLGSRGAQIDHDVSRSGGKILPCAECGTNTRSTASVGIWTTRSDRVVIEHNEVSGESKVGGDGEGFDIDESATHTVVQYNYAHDNAGGGVLVCGANSTDIRFNILENNGQAALAFYGKLPSKSTRFTNNTVYASRASAAKVVRTFGGIRGSSVSFKNNIVYSYGPGDYQWPTKKVTTAANTLIGPVASAHPHDSRTRYSGPGLKAPGTGKNGLKSLGGYKPEHPKSFQTGVAITKSVTRDFFGTKINSKHPPRGAAG